MTKFMTLVAGAALTAATAAPALADDPFVSTQNSGAENGLITTSTAAGIAAGALMLGFLLNNNSSSSTTTTTTTTTTGSTAN